MAHAVQHTHYRDLISELTRKELSVRYKHFVFGYLWSVISPLVSVLIYYIVFQIILKVKQPNYLLFLVTGIYPWQWITNSVGVAPLTFVANAPLIKKTLFPRYLIPFVTVAQDAIHFLLTLPIMIGLLLFAGLTPTLHWLWALPALFVMQFAFTYALNLFIATTTLFFRDLERFVQIIMSFLFYLTPILYSEAMIPAEYEHLIPLNPFAPLLINWRHLFLDGTIDPFYFSVSIAWSVFFLVACQWTYSRLSWRFAEIV